MMAGACPDVHAFLFSRKREKQGVQVLGSTLAITALESMTKKPVFVIRANNPQERIVQQVDNNVLTEEIVLSMIRYAIALRNENVRHGMTGDMKIVVPLDSASMSSTNRPKVAEYYHSHFTQCDKVMLEQTTSTTFNEYAIWDKHGRNGCVCIVEIKDGLVFCDADLPEERMREYEALLLKEMFPKNEAYRYVKQDEQEYTNGYNYYPNNDEE
jgi:hypothetical protein